MPLYMDIHKNVGGATPEEVYQAHEADLAIQSKYGVEYHTYWFNQGAGHVFCLMSAPNRDSAEAVHREAHGLLADEIVQVEPGTVSQFMNVDVQQGVQHPSPPPRTDDPSRIDTGVRAIMFTDIENSTAMTQRLGDAGAMEILNVHNDVVRHSLGECGGCEIKHTGDGIMASFVSISRSVTCAAHIQQGIREYGASRPAHAFRVRIGLSVGEPIEDGADLFGASVQLARRICDWTQPGTIAVTNALRELCVGKPFQFIDRGEVALKGFDASAHIHEVVWDLR